MSRYEFESSQHLFNFARKILRNNSIQNYDIEDFLRLLSERSYHVTKTFQLEIFNLGLRTPDSILTFLLKDKDDEYEIKQELKYFDTLLSMYLDLMKDEDKDKERYKIIFDLYSMPSYPLALRTFDDIRKGYVTSNELLEIQEKLRHKHGVYFLYNSKKNLIYIGKSAADLGGRIPSSIRERKAFYFSYALTESASDTSVYEMYYISKFKPSLNVDGKYPDDLTISLPDLAKTDLLPVYKKKKSVATNNGDQRKII